MVKDIKGECLQRVSELEKRKNSKETELPMIERKIQDAEARLRALTDIESKIKAILQQKPKTLSIPVLESYLSQLEEKRTATQKEVEKLKGQVIEKNEQIRLFKQESDGLAERIEGRKRSEIMRSLTRATKGRFVSEVFLKSLESALAKQRTALLEPLTEELSAIWSSFLGMNVGVELRDDAQILTVDEKNQKSLKFPQLSGGEKTALLIFTQLMLCKYFSKANFMLLDEPLEHLDSRNRWALVKFLVDTTKSGYPRQLIVTTIEEMLVREYLDDTEIAINVLSRK